MGVANDNCCYCKLAPESTKSARSSLPETLENAFFPQEPTSAVASSDPKFGLYNAVADELDELDFDEVEAADATGAVRSFMLLLVSAFLVTSLV